MEMRCIHCGSALTDGACPVCNKNQDMQNPEGALPVGFVVAERLWIGKTVHMDGEGVTYVAYDTVDERTVFLREFLPLSLCIRKPDLSILINEGSELIFKNALTAFIDLYKALSQADNLEAVQKIHGAYKFNNTVYFSLEHFEGVSLGSVLTHSSHISQEMLLNLLKPLFRTLSGLHKIGLIHGGICPDNILLNDEGEVRLIGFATNSLRTADTEIESELFVGYTSPEQYSITGWQGPWTDIYALGATLYRALTGTKPQDVKERQKNDTVLSPLSLNDTLNDNLARAIEYSLKLNYKERIKSIEELADFISGKQTEVIIPETKEEEPTAPVSARPAPRKYKTPAWVGILVGLIGVIGIAGAIWLGSYLKQDPKAGKDDMSSSQDADTDNTPTTVEVPDLIGMTFDAFDSNQKYKDEKYSFKVEYDNNDIYDEGTICDMIPSPGKTINIGESITVVVSKGKQMVDIPSIVGKNIDDVADELKAANIPYEVIEMFQSGEGGTIIRYEGDINGKVIPNETTLYIYVVAIL